MNMTTRNPSTPVAPNRAARWYWSACAVTGLILTVLVNAAHAKGVSPTPSTWTAVAVSVIPPLMFAALFEGFFLARRAVPPNVLRMVKVSVAVLGGASFAISYTSIAYFIQRRTGDLPVWTSWVMPGLLDTFVGVSAYVVYVLSKHVAAPVPSAKTVRSSRWKRLADAATARAEAILVVPEKPLVEPSVEVHGGSVEPVVDDLVEPHKSSVKPSTEAPKTPTKTSAKPSVDTELLPFMDAAEQMVTEGVVARKTAAEVARVISAIDSGLSDNAIKSAGISSASTASKVRAAMTSDSRPLIAV